MTGLDSYVGTKQTVVGIDWLNFASGAMKTAGGAFGGGAGGGSGGDAAAQAAAMQAARDQAAAAQQSAATWKMIGLVGVLVVVLGGVFLLKK